MNEGEKTKETEQQEQLGEATEDSESEGGPEDTENGWSWRFKG